MGELRYFPGSEPQKHAQDDDPGPETTSGPQRRADRADRSTATEAPRGRPAGEVGRAVDLEPAWTVPGIDPVALSDGRRPAGLAPVRAGTAGTGPADVGSAGVDAARAGHPSRGARRAENVSMAALTSHDLSESEMRTRLAARGLEPDDVEAEVARLLGSGLLDDAALAEKLIDRLRDRKGLGDAALRPALRARGIRAEVLDAALAGASDDDETAHQRLQDVADDRARRLGGLAPAVAERRLLAYLARKGYSGSAARAAARAALAGGDDPA